MAIATRRRTPPPLMAQISRHFLPHFFLLQLNPTYIETDFTLGPIKEYRF